MIPHDWACESWAWVALVMHDGGDASWWHSSEKVAMQNAVLRHVVQPEVSPRRWFFRREALKGDVARADRSRSLGLYVKLDPQAGDPVEELRPLLEGLKNARHRVETVRLWDRCFGPGYGGPVGQAALRQFCCDATDGFLKRLEPGDVDPILEEWQREGTACDWGLRHWFYWITGGTHQDLMGSLADEIKGLKHAVHSLRYDRQSVISAHPEWDCDRDSRITIFTKCMNVVQSTATGLEYVRSEVERLGQRELIASVGPGDLGREEYRRVLRFSLIALMQCAIESSFRDFLRSVSPRSCRGGRDPSFKNIYTCLLKELKLQGKWESVLDFWRLMRNTVHNNGVYRSSSGKDEEVTLEGQTYRFVDGVRAQFVNRDLLLQLTEGTVGMIYEVVTSDVLAGATRVEDASA